MAELTTRQLSANKDVRKEIKVLESLGFEHAGDTASGHPRFVHLGFGEITLPATPSSRRWKTIHRRRVAKLMGLNSHQLGKLIAGQPLQPIPATRRSSRPGRIPEHKVVIEHAESLGIPCDQAKARALLRRFTTVRAARVALDGMARSALQRAA